jgi:outer membrane protein assembly factor BamB
VIRAALLALSLLSPHVVWTARLSAPVGTPAVADGRIYVATGAAHTRLHALDAVTGRRLWSAIAGRGTLYAPLAETGVVARLSNLDTVRRYDPATGRVLWRRNGPFAEGFLAQPTLAGGRIFELSDSLVAMDARTGAQLWRAGDDCFRCRVAVDATHVYAAGKQGLRAFDVATGHVAWTSAASADLGTVSSTTVASGVVVVVSTRSRQGEWSFFLESFRARDGTPLWQTKLADTPGFDPWTAPVAAGHIVVFPAADGNLYGVDLITGAMRWRVRVGATDSTPAVAHGKVWIVGGDGRLREIDAATGSVLWTGPPTKVVANVPIASPVLDGSLVLVGTPAGNLLAFG